MDYQRRMKVVGKNETTAAAAGRLRIAFATSDMKFVNQHFGAAESFAFYSVDMESATLEEVVQFGRLDRDGNENKLIPKIAVLQGCTAVYCLAIGSSAIKQLNAYGVQPIRVNEGAMVKTLIEEFQQELREGPSSWLARAIEGRNKADDGRFDEMEAEGWNE